MILLLFFFGVKNRFLSEWVCLNNITFTFWILLYLIQQTKNEDVYVSFRYPFTWYFSVLFFYTPCTALVFSFWYYKSNGISVLENIRLLHNVFNILLYLGFSVGLLINGLYKHFKLESK
jgi:hypothetical protein